MTNPKPNVTLQVFYRFTLSLRIDVERLCPPGCGGRPPWHLPESPRALPQLLPQHAARLAGARQEDFGDRLSARPLGLCQVVVTRLLMAARDRFLPAAQRGD